MVPNEKKDKVILARQTKSNLRGNMLTLKKKAQSSDI
jgi:hypothetical protein